VLGKVNGETTAAEALLDGDRRAQVCKVLDDAMRDLVLAEFEGDALIRAAKLGRAQALIEAAWRAVPDRLGRVRSSLDLVSTNLEASSPDMGEVIGHLSSARAHLSLPGEAPAAFGARLYNICQGFVARYPAPQGETRRSLLPRRDHSVEAAALKHERARALVRVVLETDPSVQKNLVVQMVHDQGVARTRNVATPYAFHAHGAHAYQARALAERIQGHGAGPEWAEALREAVLPGPARDNCYFTPLGRALLDMDLRAIQFVPRFATSLDAAKAREKVLKEWRDSHGKDAKDHVGAPGSIYEMAQTLHAMLDA
jgi:hypothetical protein